MRNPYGMNDPYLRAILISIAVCILIWAAIAFGLIEIHLGGV